MQYTYDMDAIHTMASSPKQEKQTTCCFCGNTLFVKDWPNLRSLRCPMLLPCGHSACRQCLNSYANLKQEASCQYCNSVVTFSSTTDVERTFPVNYYLFGLLLHKEAVSRQTGRNVQFIPAGAPIAQQKRPALAVRPLAHKPNSVCFECSTYEAMCRCEQCDTIYCHGCFSKVHKSAKALRTHTCVLITEGLENSFMLGTCPTHPDAEYRFFCEQDSAFVCSTCAVLKHNGHKLQEVDVMNNNLLPQVQQAAASVNKMLKKLIHTKKELQEMRPSVKNEKLANVRRKVVIHFARLHGWLQMQEEKFNTDLDMGGLGCLEDIDVMCQELDEQSKSVQKLLRAAQKAVDPIMLPRLNLSKILTELNDAISLPCQIALPEENNTLDVNFEVTNDILPLLQDHCKLRVTAPAPPSLISLLPEEMEKSDAAAMSEIAVDETENITDLYNNPFMAALECGTPKSSSPLPAIVSPRRSRPIDLTEGFSELVILSHVASPSDFYVQRKTDKHLIDQLMKDLDRAAPTCKPIPQPNVGNLCLVQYSLDSKWYRGRIKEMKQNEEGEFICQVLYLDYGNTEEVSVNRVFAPPKQLCLHEPFCKHCRLAEILPAEDKWSDEAVRVFVEMTTRPRVQMVMKSITGNTLEVDLIILSSDNIGNSYEPVSVRESLAFLGHGDFTKSADTFVQESKILRTGDSYHSGHYSLVAGSSVEVLVSHIETPHCFYVQRVGQHSAKLSQLMRSLRQYYENVGSKFNIYCPFLGMKCVAKYSEDGNWYRALVTEIPNKRLISVQYVDYGNSEVVDCDNVKKIHEKFLSLDAQAIRCKIFDLELPEGTQGWSEEACIKFRSICYNKFFRMIVNNRESNQFVVSLYEQLQHTDQSVAVAMALAGFGICSRKRKSKFNDFSAHIPVQKRVNLQDNTHSESQSKQAFLGPQSGEAHDKMGRGNYTPFLEVQPCMRADPTVPVEAILAPSMVTPKKATPLPRETPFRIQVEVIAHNSPGEMYIRILSLEPQLDKMMEDLQLYFKTPPAEVDKQWEIDQLCAVKKPLDGQWCRAIVIEKGEDDNVKVFLTDIALTLDLKTSDLHTLPDEFQGILHGAVKCHLAGIHAAGDRDVWPILAREKLSDLLLAYESVYMTKKGNMENNSLPVELWVEDVLESGALQPTVLKWTTLNQKLVEQGVAIPLKSSEVICLEPDSVQLLQELMQHTKLRFNLPSSSADTMPDWRQLCQDLNEPAKVNDEDKDNEPVSEPMLIDISDENVNDLAVEGRPRSCVQWVEPELPTRLAFKAKTTYIDDEGHFYLQELPKSERAMAKLQRMVDQHYKDSLPAPEDMLWSENQICVAKYHIDNNWYRAKIREILDSNCDELNVQFVDYGNTETVPVQDLRKAAFVTTVPIQCFKCEFFNLVPLGDNQQWTTAVLDIIHGSIVDKKCKVVLEELPLPGELVKVKSLVTELGRDIFEYLITNKLATHSLESPSLTEITNDNLPADIITIQEEQMQISQVQDQSPEQMQVSQQDKLDPHSLLKVPQQNTNDTASYPEGFATPEPMQDIEVVETEVAVMTELGDQAIMGNDIAMDDVSKPLEEEGNTQDKTEAGDMQPEHLLDLESDINMQDQECQVVKEADTGVQVVEVVNHKQVENLNGKLVMENSEKDTLGPQKQDDMEVGTARESMLQDTESGDNEASKNIVKEFPAEDEDDILIITNINSTLKPVICLSSDEEASSCSSFDNSSQASSLIDVSSSSTEPDNKFGNLCIPRDAPMLADITVVISPVEFYVKPAMQENTDALQLLTEEISKEAPEMPVLKNVAIGEVCCARYTNQYFRALITDIAEYGEMATISFVDYGNMETVAVSRLFEMKASWMTLPRQALRCVVKDIQVVPDANEELLDAEVGLAMLSGPVFVMFNTVEEPCEVHLLQQDRVTSLYEQMLEKNLVKVTTAANLQ